MAEEEFARVTSITVLVISFDLSSVVPEATCNLGAAKPPDRLRLTR